MDFYNLQQTNKQKPPNYWEWEESAFYTYHIIIFKYSMFNNSTKKINHKVYREIGTYDLLKETKKHNKKS